MIYLAIYNRKSEIAQSPPNARQLIFIEAGDRLRRDQVVALVGTLTGGNFEESSVEIIGQKAWDATKIKHPRIKLHKLEETEAI
jgi:hypothetical protein